MWVGSTWPYYCLNVLAFYKYSYWYCNIKNINEPQHDKTIKGVVRPAKTQFSLGIPPVWSESSLSAWRNLGSLATHWAHSEDSDQTGRMPRLIWVFAWRRLILFVLSCRGSNVHRKLRTSVIVSVFYQLILKLWKIAFCICSLFDAVFACFECQTRAFFCVFFCSPICTTLTTTGHLSTRFISKQWGVK